MAIRPEWKVGKMEIMNVDAILGKEGGSMIAGAGIKILHFGFLDGTVWAYLQAKGWKTVNRKQRKILIGAKFLKRKESFKWENGSYGIQDFLWTKGSPVRMNTV